MVNPTQVVPPPDTVSTPYPTGNPYIPQGYVSREQEFIMGIQYAGHYNEPPLQYKPSDFPPPVFNGMSNGGPGTESYDAIRSSYGR